MSKSRRSVSVQPQPQIVPTLGDAISAALPTRFSKILHRTSGVMFGNAIARHTSRQPYVCLQCKCALHTASLLQYPRAPLGSRTTATPRNASSRLTRTPSSAPGRDHGFGQERESVVRGEAKAIGRFSSSRDRGGFSSSRVRGGFSSHGDSKGQPSFRRAEGKEFNSPRPSTFRSRDDRATEASPTSSSRRPFSARGTRDSGFDRSSSKFSMNRGSRITSDRGPASLTGFSREDGAGNGRAGYTGRFGRDEKKSSFTRDSGYKGNSARTPRSIGSPPGFNRGQGVENERPRYAGRLDRAEGKPSLTPGSARTPRSFDSPPDFNRGKGAGSDSTGYAGRFGRREGSPTRPDYAQKYSRTGRNELGSESTEQWLRTSSSPLMTETSNPRGDRPSRGYGDRVLGFQGGSARTPRSFDSPPDFNRGKRAGNGSTGYAGRFGRREGSPTRPEYTQKYSRTGRNEMDSESTEQWPRTSSPPLMIETSNPRGNRPSRGYRDRVFAQSSSGMQSQGDSQEDQQKEVRKLRLYPSINSRIPYSGRKTAPAEESLHLDKDLPYTKSGRSSLPLRGPHGSKVSNSEFEPRTREARSSPDPKAWKKPLRSGPSIPVSRAERREQTLLKRMAKKVARVKAGSKTLSLATKREVELWLEPREPKLPPPPPSTAGLTSSLATNAPAPFPTAGSTSLPTFAVYNSTVPPTIHQLDYANHFFTEGMPSFLYASNKFREMPLSSVPEVVFLGRSNVGKSSLLNALVGRTGIKIANVSSKPGRTKSMNAFGVGGEGGVRWARTSEGEQVMGEQTAGEINEEKARDTLTGKGGLVVLDMPGYGKASQTAWGEEIQKYLFKRKQLRKTFVLVNAMHGLKDTDHQVLSILRQNSVPHQIIVTKIDRAILSYKKSFNFTLEELKASEERVIPQLCENILAAVKAKEKEEGRGGVKLLEDVLCCSSEMAERFTHGRKLGIDAVRFAVLAACGLEPDEAGRKKIFEMGALDDVGAAAVMADTA